MTELTSPVGGNFKVVGMGASAGGLAAFREFFSGMRIDIQPNMAFVLVQHLAADRKSLLAELIQRCTSLEVKEINDGMAVKPNKVYILSPGHNLEILNDTFHLIDHGLPAGQRRPIDSFFRSMSLAYHERAIGVVFSGSGSDGAAGVCEIKTRGGTVFAQTPESCEYPNMPESAISTGLVDLVAAPSEMSKQILNFDAKNRVDKESKDMYSDKKMQNSIAKIFLLIRTQTSHDFSQYKPSTLLRRIERRMAVNQIGDLGEYVKYLQHSPVEVEALFHDMLIGVTSFFRDPEAFLSLKTLAIPSVFAAKPAGYTARVWIPGCSTGEEVYSIAILFREFIQNQNMPYKVQIFATDIDSRAINVARKGCYSDSINANISADRLKKYFTPSSDGTQFHIKKKIRDMIVFSEQNVIKDPPFSKLDFISCRNLMIYFGLELQKKIIPLFHYGLKPNGLLFLGNSEGIGEFGSLFSVVDRTAKIFHRREDREGILRASLSKIIPELKQFNKENTYMSNQSKSNEVSLKHITEQALMLHVFVAGVLINQQGDILYTHGRTGQFLEPTPGVSGINNIFKMAREGLKAALLPTFRKVKETKDVIVHPNINVRTNGHFSTVNLAIRPIPSRIVEFEHLYLVILEERKPSVPVPVTAAPTTTSASEKDLKPDDIIANLKERLRAKAEFLHSTQEELMSSNEELKSANEELQSMNEELQSTNEELETSKEELQSINEELTTVNSELQIKVADLTRANNDMNNLMAGTGIATLFVDIELRILRFTPSIVKIINLIEADVGRPISHIVSNLGEYKTLNNDIQNVLNNLVPLELEVVTNDGLWYLMRIRPYRTTENVIEGAVVSFTDISSIVEARETAKSMNKLSRMAVIVRDSFDAIILQDLKGQILAWNPAATKLYGWTEFEALRLNVRDRIPKELMVQEVETLSRIQKAEVIETYVTKRLHKNGGSVPISIAASQLQDDCGKAYAITTIERKLNGDIA